MHFSLWFLNNINDDDENEILCTSNLNEIIGIYYGNVSVCFIFIFGSVKLRQNSLDNILIVIITKSDLLIYTNPF